MDFIYDDDKKQQKR